MKSKPYSLLSGWRLLALSSLLLATACGGGGGGSSSSSTTSGSGSASSSGAGTGSSGSSTDTSGSGASSGSGAGASSGSGSGTGTSTDTGTTTTVDGHTAIQQAPLAQRAGVLAKALGRSQRLLVGLGTVNVAPIQAQGLLPDIYDQYLVGVGPSSWPSWNSPSGAYVTLVAQRADQLGAVPMFTLYQMATRGDGVLTGLADTTYMTDYWNNARLLFQLLANYGKPALVNLEPDFWGYAQRVNADPTQMLAYVNINPDCASLPNTVAGMAACLMQSARKIAPQAYVGFPPSLFEDLRPTEVAYMQKLGADQADFVVMQTLDRDAGCFEARSILGECTRAGSNWYWDETNTTSPTFNEHFALANRYFQGLGRPLLWWQTPLGVPAASPSTTSPWRDNRVRYFLTHPDQLVAAGGVGVVFSPGQSAQTTIQTDGGQFQTYSKAYLAKPTALP